MQNNRKCLFCEKVVYTQAKYCSKRCRGYFVRHKKKKSELKWCINCPVCNKRIKVKNIGRKQFCSNRCQGKSWRKRNLKKALKISKEWYKNNKERRLKKAKEWVQKNRKKYAKMQSKWYFKHKKEKRRKERERFFKKPKKVRQQIYKKKNKWHYQHYQLWKVKENERRKNVGLPLIGEKYHKELELKIIIEKILKQKCIYRGFYILSKNNNLEKVSSGSRNKGNRQLDIYFPKLKLAFEYDGEQHYKDKKGWVKEPLKIIQKRDKDKNKICKKANIKMIRIPYWEKITKQNIIQILHKNGIMQIVHTF